MQGNKKFPSLIISITIPLTFKTYPIFIKIIFLSFVPNVNGKWLTGEKLILPGVIGHQDQLA